MGTYLVPRLVMSGHQVINVSRKRSEPYNQHAAWNSVQQISIDREKSDLKGNFGNLIEELQADIVIDMICFSLESATSMAEALMGKVQHFLHCGTIWVHGHSEQVPTSESQPRKPFGSYGINKEKIETYLLTLSSQQGFPATIIHPGHICGPGWLPVNPAGNFNPKVFQSLAKGEEVLLPNFGMETLHHVHADDVAQGFIRAIDNRNNSIGESFHLVSEQALTLSGYALAIGKWYGKEAKLKYLHWEEWKKYVSKEDADLTWDHISHSPNASIAKAKRLLQYHPRYTSLEAVQDALSQYVFD